MALDRQKKSQIITEIDQLFDRSKLIVLARYAGTSVKSMQDLRAQSREGGTTIKVVKNRLVKKALEQNQKYKNLDTSLLSGQIMYVFNPNDEVAPAQAIAEFAKTQPQVEFVGAITNEAEVLSADDVKSLAALPSKDQLRAQLIGTIGAPFSGFVNVLSGNLRSVFNVLNAHGQSIK